MRVWEPGATQRRIGLVGRHQNQFYQPCFLVLGYAQNVGLSPTLISASRAITQGVLQGKSLGPLLFAMSSNVLSHSAFLLFPLPWHWPSRISISVCGCVVKLWTKRLSSIQNIVHFVARNISGKRKLMIKWRAYGRFWIAGFIELRCVFYLTLLRKM